MGIERHHLLVCLESTARPRPRQPSPRWPRAVTPAPLDNPRGVARSDATRGLVLATRATGEGETTRHQMSPNVLARVGMQHYGRPSGSVRLRLQPDTACACAPYSTKKSAFTMRTSRLPGLTWLCARIATGTPSWIAAPSPRPPFASWMRWGRWRDSRPRRAWRAPCSSARR